MANGIKKPAVGAHQTGVNSLQHPVATTICRDARRYLLILLFNQRRLGRLEGLMRFRATENFQKFGVDHKSM